jgi:hypothetical protein
MSVGYLVSHHYFNCLSSGCEQLQREREKCEATDSVDLKSKWAHSSEKVVPLLCTEKPFQLYWLLQFHKVLKIMYHIKTLNFIEFFSPVPETFCLNNLIALNELVDRKSMTLEKLDILMLCISRIGYTFCQKSATLFQHHYNNVHLLIYGKFIGMWYVLLPVIFSGRKSSKTYICLWVWPIKLEVIAYCILCCVFATEDLLCWLLRVFFKSAIHVVWIANFLFFEKAGLVMCAIRREKDTI